MNGNDDDDVFIGDASVVSSSMDNRARRRIDVYVNESGEKEIEELQRLMDEAASECLRPKELRVKSPSSLGLSSPLNTEIKETEQTILQEHKASSEASKGFEGSVNQSVPYLGLNDTYLYYSTIGKDGDGAEYKVTCCQFCNYQTSGDIEPHMAKHLSQRSCDACGRVFETPTTLMAHRQFLCNGKKDSNPRYNENFKTFASFDGRNCDDFSECSEPNVQTEFLTSPSCESYEDSVTYVPNKSPGIVVIESDSEPETVELTDHVTSTPTPPTSSSQPLVKWPQDATLKNSSLLRSLLNSNDLEIGSELSTHPFIGVLKTNVKCASYNSKYLNGKIVKICQICPYSSSSFEQMDRHIRLHPTCDSCAKIFRRASEMFTHREKCRLIKNRTSKMYKKQSGNSINRDTISVKTKSQLKKRIMRKNKVISVGGRQAINGVIEIETNSTNTDTDMVEDKLEECGVTKDDGRLCDASEEGGSDTSVFEVEEEEEQGKKTLELEIGGGNERRYEGKRRCRLVVDSVTRLDNQDLSESHLAVTGRQTLAEPDYAPITKRLVRFQRDDGRLLHIPAREIKARELLKLYDRHTHTQPHTHEHMHCLASALSAGTIVEGDWGISSLAW